MPKLELGQIFTHIGSASEGIEWVVALKHRDNSDIFYIVPIDMFYWLGTWDVAAEFRGEEMAIRCSRGIWIGTKVFDYWLKTSRIQLSGVIAQSTIDKIQLRLAAMVGEGECEYIEEVDLDPDYQEHLDILSKMEVIITESAVSAYEFVAKESGIDVPVEWFRYKW
jgi:hypothetical protein